MYCGANGRVPLEWALHGGEDYALLLAVDGRKAESVADDIRRVLKAPARVVGRFTGRKRRYDCVTQPRSSAFSFFRNGSPSLGADAQTQKGQVRQANWRPTQSTPRRKDAGSVPETRIQVWRGLTDLCRSRWGTALPNSGKCLPEFMLRVGLDPSPLFAELGNAGRPKVRPQRLRWLSRCARSWT